MRSFNILGAIHVVRMLVGKLHKKALQTATSLTETAAAAASAAVANDESSDNQSDLIE